MAELTTEWQKQRFVAFDLETTGTDRENDRITELGFVVFEKGEIVDRHQALVNPGVPIPEEVVKVTGITDEDVADQPPLREMKEVLSKYLAEPFFLAFNAGFDVPFLENELKRIGLCVPVPRCFDPFPFVWKNLRDGRHIKNAKLGTVCEYLGIPLENAHRADHDAEAAGHVFLRMNEFAELPPDVESLLTIQQELSRQIEAMFARRRGGFTSVGETTVELGAAYVYGDERDPLRYLYSRLPDVRDVVRDDP